MVYLRELKEQYQYTVLGWRVPLDYVKERCIQDVYGDRADQMWRLMVITDMAHHLDARTELAGRYVA